MLLQVAPIGNHLSTECALDLFVLLPDGADPLMLDQGIPRSETFPAVATVVGHLVLVEAPFFLVPLPVRVLDPLPTVRTELPLHDARWSFERNDLTLLSGCDLFDGRFGLHQCQLFRS